MSDGDQQALYQELFDAVLRCRSSLWLCQTCQQVVAYDRRMEQPLGQHQEHAAQPIPLLFDEDEGCERGFLSGWIENLAEVTPQRRGELLDRLRTGQAPPGDFITQELSDEEREAYERYRTDEAESLVLELLAPS